MYRFVWTSAIVVSVLGAPTAAFAQPELIDDLGGPTGFGTDCLAPNDDQSSPSIDITSAFPGGLEFFGRRHSRVFVNTNGNITFNAALSTFTPEPIPLPATFTGRQPMIAPYWADVDIRGVSGTCATRTTNGVWWHLSEGQLVVTWDRVGYYNQHNDLQMTFQLIIREARYCGIPGDFDVEFRFTQCEWETGDASSGSGGFGGTPAQVGFDAANGLDFVTIPGSRVNGISRVMCDQSNVGEPGVWRFAIRRGEVECPDAGDICTVPGQIGQCADGRTQCEGSGVVCEALVGPTEETCDSYDNDCDGTTDEGENTVLCPGLQVCDRGRCIDPCFEGGCSEGYTCSESGVCLENACEGVTCEAGQRCIGGTCGDVCAGVVCPDGQSCVGGRCEDLCANIECGQCQICDAGSCITRCEVAGCRSGEACDETGRCVEEACLGVICGPNRSCRGGRCVSSCEDVVCPMGQMCVDGVCEREVPVMPDAGERPDAYVPQPFDAGMPDSGSHAPPPPGDGCGCSVPGGTQSSVPTTWMLVLAIGVVLAVRRRGAQLLPFVVAGALAASAAACTTRPEGNDPMDDPCGDGTVTFPELCDDGGDADGDGCSALCFVESGFTCTGSPSVCTEIGEEPVCGNRAIEAGEECDDGTESVECDLDCTRAVCGDGELNRRAGEECDDENDVDGDGCSAVCSIEPRTCGDGTCDAGETCTNCVPDCAETAACVDCSVDYDGDGAFDSACGGTDCNDSDPNVHPGATEVPCNRIDEDCSTTTLDAVDADGDRSSCNFDCDDNDPMRSPLFLELCSDGIDNDCAERTTDVFDADGDGATCDVDCDDYRATTCPDCDELCNNTLDDDCDPSTPDRFDGDGDTSSCEVDCDDDDPRRRPGGSEICDGLDNDCDGLLDGTNEDDDRDGHADVACGAACVGRCGDCLDTNAAVHPDSHEVCGNVIDDDCDAATLDDVVDLDSDGAFCDIDCDDGDATLVPNAAGVCGTPFAYVQGFETDAGGWAGTGSWARGRPTKDFITRAGEGENAWVTNLTADYPDNETSYLTSPVIDMSTATTDVVLSFAHIFETESCCDRSWLELSLNGGSTWTKVGMVGQGTNWYGDTSNQAWAGTSGEAGVWRRASITLPGTARQANVRLRFYFRTDTSSVRDGFGVDDIRMGDQLPDLAVTAVAVSSANACAGVATPVTASVQNTGTTTIGAYDLSYAIDAGAPITERVTRTLRPGQIYEHTFATPAVLPAGTPMVRVTVALAGDLAPSNDSRSAATAISPVIAVSAGATYLEGFEGGAGGWLAGGTNSSWARGVPMNTFIDMAGAGTNAWVTNLTGPYNSNERSFVTSPCFDFSALATDPTLSMLLVHKTRSSGDSGWIEVSLDGTWTKLGAAGEGTNWYGDAANSVWRGTSEPMGNWVTASHVVTGSAGLPVVRFRFVFQSDGSGTDEGFGFDAVGITP
ncbi:nidogen-like domain-containing protein [Sandaracinus amylolyticus]|uniref:nidogen-like domain-containing protein n=1 Tax=Sandaracinus amylolyticus TaxID=927083 RepID=UPI001F3FC27C|nr:nidogen-like domain-containing protein [Sandaracinus amylolyticus]UJR84714.1 Hypothetical protein I5071_67930 [Sandaracinus amylolyticus]